MSRTNISSVQEIGNIMTVGSLMLNDYAVTVVAIIAVIVAAAVPSHTITVNRNSYYF